MILYIGIGLMKEAMGGLVLGEDTLFKWGTNGEMICSWYGQKRHKVCQRKIWNGISHPYNSVMAVNSEYYQTWFGKFWRYLSLETLFLTNP